MKIASFEPLTYAQAFKDVRPDAIRYHRRAAIRCTLDNGEQHTRYTMVGYCGATGGRHVAPWFNKEGGISDKAELLEPQLLAWVAENGHEPIVAATSLAGGPP